MIILEFPHWHQYQLPWEPGGDWFIDHCSWLNGFLKFVLVQRYRRDIFNLFLLVKCLSQVFNMFPFSLLFRQRPQGVLLEAFIELVHIECSGDIQYLCERQAFGECEGSQPRDIECEQWELTECEDSLWFLPRVVLQCGGVRHDGVVRLQQSCLIHHNLRSINLQLLYHGGVLLVVAGGLEGLQTDEVLWLLVRTGRHVLWEVDELRVTVR